MSRCYGGVPARAVPSSSGPRFSGRLSSLVPEIDEKYEFQDGRKNLAAAVRSVAQAHGVNELSLRRAYERRNRSSVVSEQRIFADKEEADIAGVIVSFLNG